MTDSQNVLRKHAEAEFHRELEAIISEDNRAKPPQWKMSPWGVLLYLMGGKTESGVRITPKYIGDKRLMEMAIATMTTDRALLLLGVPGTAKSVVSEHLAAAISGDSTMLVQGTANTSEESIRYGWNYAMLLAKGPSIDAVVASPVMRSMREGKIARVEEFTRIPSEIQDSFLTILSEKMMPIPELNLEVQAEKGFNMIATANDRDRGVNEMSSAMKRRFNTIVLPPPKTVEQEVSIVMTRVASMGRSLDLPCEVPALQEIKRIVTIFRELRSGKTIDERMTIKSPSGTMSVAEAISVAVSGMSRAAHFGDGVVRSADLAGSLVSAILQDPVQDAIVLKEYLETVVKNRSEWSDLYRAIHDYSK